ncbi:MAG: hypothetical protein KAS87_02025 [Candidatus Omnitrophica bacterium]|nr:hypothetical protein [Candidatus Omnitrophota bacterium]
MKKILGVIILVLAVFFLVLFFKMKAGRQTASLIEPTQIKKMLKKAAPKKEIKFLEEKIPSRREIIEPSEDLPGIHPDGQSDEDLSPQQEEKKEIRLRDISQEPSIPDVYQDVPSKKKTPSKKELEQMGKKGIVIY